MNTNIEQYANDNCYSCVGTGHVTGFGVTESLECPCTKCSICGDTRSVGCEDEGNNYCVSCYNEELTS